MSKGLLVYNYKPLNSCNIHIRVAPRTPFQSPLQTPFLNLNKNLLQNAYKRFSLLGGQRSEEKEVKNKIKTKNLPSRYNKLLYK